MSAPGTARDVLAAFADAMAGHGLASRSPIRADGELHRFHVEGDSPGRKNGFYVLHPDGPCPAGMFGCWKRGIKQTWKANGAQLGEEVLAKLARKVKADRQRRRREETRRHEDAAHAAMDRWVRRCRPAPGDHPYLARKRVRPHGTRADDEDKLVVPLSDADGKLWSLQTIDAQGAKRYMFEGRVRGCMFWIGEPSASERVVVAEGFATAASVHEATGLPVAVAFDAGNLEPVAQAIRKKWPEARIVVAADDDCETPGNPGLAAARKAAEAVGATVAVPARRQPDGRKLDFNDLALEEGHEAVARIILAAFSEKREPEPESEPEPGADTGPRAEAGDDGWEAPLLAAIDELNDVYFVSQSSGQAVIASVERDQDRKRDRLVFSREADIRLLYGHRHYLVGHTSRGNEIRKDLGSAWIAHRFRRTFRRIALIPKGPCPPDTYNLWRGFGVAPQAGGWSTIERHLREVVCDGDQDNHDWLVRWFARAVQHPEKQAEVAVVMRGLKGTGKGMCGQLLVSLFRNHALQVTHQRHLVGNFNAHLVDTLALFVDEAFWAGDKQGEGVLKGLITEPSLMIEPKHVNAFTVPNRLKIIMSANADWVVPATADERRYFVLDVPSDRKGDKAYFTRLAAAIEGLELSAFLSHLLNLDLSDFDHRNPPHTEGLNRQKLLGGDSLQKFWFDCLTMGQIIGAETGDGWPEMVPCQDLQEAYLEHAHAHGDRHPLTKEQFGVKLRRLCPEGQLRSVRPTAKYPHGPRPRSFELKSLEEQREAFLIAMNIAAHEWPDVEGEE